MNEEYDEPIERGRSKMRRTPSVEVEIDRSKLGLYNYFPTKT